MFLPLPKYKSWFVGLMSEICCPPDPFVQDVIVVEDAYHGNIGTMLAISPSLHSKVQCMPCCTLYNSLVVLGKTQHHSIRQILIDTT